MKRALKWTGLVLGVVLLLIAAAVFTFPYWFGTALQTGAKRFGVSVGKYEKLADGRFALSDVIRTNRFFDFKASRVEGYMPHTWYQEVKGTNRSKAFFEVDGWRVTVHEREPADNGRGTKEVIGVYDRWKKIEDYITKVRQWLPKATLLNGTVEFGGREYTLPLITWEEGKLEAGGVWPISAVPFDIKGKLTGELPYQISYLMSPLDLRARLQVMETNGLLNTKLAAFYKETRADITADFGQEGVLPLHATLKAPSFKIPGDLLNLERQYNEFTGSLLGEWRTNRYSVTLTAHADPISGAKVPRADIELSASGDTNQVRIEKARSTAPGMELSISDPIELTYGGRLLSERSEMRIAADLERLPWMKLKGHFEGTLLLKQGEKFPIATIRAAGSKVEAFNVPAEEIQVAAVVNWPRLESFELRAQLWTNTTLSATGSADLAGRSIENMSLQLEGEGATNLLPANVAFGQIKFAVVASGGLSNLTHSGEFDVRDFVAAHTRPLQLSGRWRARMITFDELAFRASAGRDSLELSGHGFADGNRTNFVLRELSLNAREQALVLQEEATITLSEGRSIQVSPLRLKNDHQLLAFAATLAWPTNGRVDVVASNLTSGLVQGFFTNEIREVDIRQLSLSARWSNGPLFGTLVGNLSADQKPFGRLTADVNLALDESGLTLGRVLVEDANGEMIRGRGFLPVAINPFEANRFSISRSNHIEFALSTSTNQEFWNTVGNFAKVRVTNAAVDLVVHGPTQHPTGQFHVRAEALDLMQTNRELPTLGPFDARIALNEDVLRVREASLAVLGQTATISGNLRLGSNFWTQRREELLKYALDHAEFRIEAPNVQLAPFTGFLSKYLSPQGELAIDLALLPDRKLDGGIRMSGVETRPLPRIGVVQSVQAELKLKGQQLEIKELSGLIGGERLAMNGTVDLSPESVAKGYPDIDLAIKGNNVPLARNPDVILRSDLDLRVQNDTNNAPIISGSATLRDSFLLRDIATLVPGRVAGPSRRPPYFSIEQDPMDDWRLDIRVRGENFMRVRSPFFQGVVSANFNVVGTAEEPTALGEATLSSGRIIFPFASLDVRQAIVSLTEEDPYLPHVFAVARGRAFGFEIRMQAEGPANEPVIEFSSVPALSSEQIILMLTTGQIPREDFNFSSRDRMGKLAFFLGKSLLDKWRPGQPGEEKLTIRSGQDITEQGRQTYEVEYKLSPRWSLVGEYDRFGALNANIKWRVLSR